MLSSLIYEPNIYIRCTTSVHLATHLYNGVKKWRPNYKIALHFLDKFYFWLKFLVKFFTRTKHFSYVERRQQVHTNHMGTHTHKLPRKCCHRTSWSAVNFIYCLHATTYIMIRTFFTSSQRRIELYHTNLISIGGYLYSKPTELNVDNL